MDQYSEKNFLDNSLMDNLEINESEKTHLIVMKYVLNEISKAPFVFKGGSALLFCYGLNRFSEDLDFDCAKRINPRAYILEAFKVINAQAAFIQNNQRFNLLMIKTAKDTETTSRFIIGYSFSKNGTDQFLDTLKLEISHRNELLSTKNFENFINKNKPYNVYKLEYLLENKLICIGAYPEISHGRSQIRDLYDVAFISQHFPKAFSCKQASALNGVCKNLDKLISQFQPSFCEDRIVKKIIDLESLVLKLTENSERLLKLQQDKSFER